ncbi:hypothetical protein [Actinomadura sp. DC4]|uniref:hypothetical protein n=1 Tax=Actinomadura sp. DC4 TaxID=3055069 RepID=UPI0025B0C569|nr:hypothetical protein [Actinomadura sp. DC4]MDN3355779.1 hypothetical protein [Actinomadura sp. DC4]
MANRSYLFVGDHEGINPGWRAGVPDLGQQVLAEDVYCVPLLWLAMFRPADLVTTTFPPEDPDDDEGPIEATAPLAPKGRALAQLDAALPSLHEIFDGAGRLDDHAALLRQGVEEMPGRFVTIELYEIAVLIDERTFYRDLRAALGGLDRPGPPGRARLADLAQLREGRPFPPARLVLDGLDASDDDCWNHSRLLGVSFLRPVPWEPARTASA